MSEVFRSEAQAASSNLMGQALATGFCLAAALISFTAFWTFSNGAWFGAGFAVATFFFGRAADRNWVLVKRYIQHPPNEYHDVE